MNIQELIKKTNKALGFGSFIRKGTPILDLEIHHQLDIFSDKKGSILVPLYDIEDNRINRYRIFSDGSISTIKVEATDLMHPILNIENGDNIYLFMDFYDALSFYSLTYSLAVYICPIDSAKTMIDKIKKRFQKSLVFLCVGQDQNNFEELRNENEDVVVWGVLDPETRLAVNFYQMVLDENYETSLSNIQYALLDGVEFLKNRDQDKISDALTKIPKNRTQIRDFFLAGFISNIKNSQGSFSTSTTKKYHTSGKLSVHLDSGQEFPLIQDFKWENVVIKWISEEEVLVTYTKPPFEGKFTYGQLGFRDRKASKPNAYWGFMRGATTNQGWDVCVSNLKLTQKQRDQLKHYISNIRKCLKAVFKTTLDPFESYEKEQRFFPLFSIHHSNPE